MKKFLSAILAIITIALVALVSAAMAEYAWAPWTERVTLGVVFTTPQGNLPTLEVGLEGTLAGKNPGKRSVGNSHGVVAGTISGYASGQYRGKYLVDATVTWLDEGTEDLVGVSADELLDLTVMPVKASVKDAEAFRVMSAGKIRQAEKAGRATKVALWQFDGANGSVGLQAEEWAIVRKDGAQFHVLVVIGKGTERTVTRKSNGGSNGGSSSNPPSGGDDDTPAAPEDEDHTPTYDPIIPPPVYFDVEVDPTPSTPSTPSTPAESDHTPTYDQIEQPPQYFEVEL